MWLFSRATQERHTPDRLQHFFKLSKILNIPSPKLKTVLAYRLP